jgi:hypothetical protein
MYLFLLFVWYQIFCAVGPEIYDSPTNAMNVVGPRDVGVSPDAARKTVSSMHTGSAARITYTAQHDTTRHKTVNPLTPVRARSNFVCWLEYYFQVSFHTKQVHHLVAQHYSSLARTFS